MSCPFFRLNCKEPCCCGHFLPVVQVRVLLERAQVVSKKWDNAPVVICGDFNCVPKVGIISLLP